MRWPWSIDALAATNQFDLLTVVMHEMGHMLGHSDLYDTDHGSELMSGYLQPGERHFPAGLDSLSRNDGLHSPGFERTQLFTQLGTSRLLDSQSGSLESPVGRLLTNNKTRPSLLEGSLQATNLRESISARVDRESDVLIDLLKDRDRLDNELDELFANLDEDGDDWMFD